MGCTIGPHAHLRSVGVGKKNAFWVTQYLILKFLLFFYNCYFVQEYLRQTIIMKIFACLYYPFPNFRMSTQSEIRKKKKQTHTAGKHDCNFFKKWKGRHRELQTSDPGKNTGWILRPAMLRLVHTRRSLWTTEVFVLQYDHCLNLVSISTNTNNSFHYCFFLPLPLQQDVRHMGHLHRHLTYVWSLKGPVKN